MKLIGAVLLAVASAAAAQDIPVKRTGGEFDKAVSFSGPELKTRSAAHVSSGQGDELFVKVNLSKDKTTGQHHWRLILQAMYDANAWRHYSGVNLVGGVVLPGHRANSHVLSCSRYFCRYAEVLVVPLSDELVQRSRVEGLRTRWNAQLLGGFEMDIPAAHFAAVHAAASGQPAPSVNWPAPPANLFEGYPASQGATPAPRPHRPASCDWPGTKQGVGAC